MSYTSYITTSSDNERAFVKKFMSDFAAASTKIVSNTTDINTQYSETTNIPEFTFTICGGVNISFLRPAKISTSASGFNVRISYSDGAGNTPELIASLPFISSNTATTASAQRTWKFAIAENANGIHIRLGSYLADMRAPRVSSLSRAMDIFVLGDGTLYGFNTISTSSGHNSVIDGTFYIKSGTDVTSVTPYSRMPYSHSTDTTIGRIAGKVFLYNGVAERMLTTTALEDCTNIGIEQIFFAGGKKYYSVNSNTLMEV